MSNGADTPRPDDRGHGRTGWQPGPQGSGAEPGSQPRPGSDEQGLPATAPQPAVGQDPRLGQAPQDPGAQPDQGGGRPHHQGTEAQQGHGAGARQARGAAAQPGPAPASDPYGQPAPQSPYSAQPSGQQPYAAAPGEAGPYASAHGASAHAPQAAQSSGPGRRRGGAGAGMIAGGLILSALVGAGTYAAVDAATGSDGGSTAEASRELIVNDTDSVTEITGAAAKASPSVVTISSADGQSAGSGSGIILDEEGHILTNTHVVTMDGQASDPSIEVQLSDGTVTTAEVVGTDPLSDLAVIKIDHDGLVPAELGSSADLNVGETAIAIGAPLGLSGTVTDGIISTTDRTIAVASSAVPDTPDEGETSEDGGGGWQDFFFDYGQGDSSQGQAESVFLNVIQTDASINPGNSGGALVDVDGKVVGINVAIASASGEESAGAGSIGVGFAIPIDHAQRVAQEIIDTGEATHGYLGASVSAAAADDGDSQTFSQGALVRSVEDGSPAEEAGLREGDIVRSFNGHTTLDADELTAAVRELPAGGTGELVYERDGREQTVEITVGDAEDA